jgi:hypothetical protein
MIVSLATQETYQWCIIRKESILLLVEFLIARDIEYIFSIEKYEFYILYKATFLIFCFLSKITLVKL